MKIPIGQNLPIGFIFIIYWIGFFLIIVLFAGLNLNLQAIAVRAIITLFAAGIMTYVVKKQRKKK